MSTPDETRSAGRGLLSITFAKVFFIVTSYAIQLLLPRFLGSPASFGLYSTAMNVVSILNNVLIVSTVQSVSKFVSEDEALGEQTLRRNLGFQAVVGTTLSVALMLGAGFIADALHDDAVTPLLRVSATVVFSYSLYAALVGSLNGRRLFQKQATLDMTFSTMRTAGILGAAALGYGALGAISGFAAAAVAILVIAALRVGIGEKPTAPSIVTLRRWLAFTAPLWLYQICLNGLMQIDLATLKRTVAELAMEAGNTAKAAADIASTDVGLYRAVQTFAFIPYQLILSITFIIFPMVSRAMADKDEDATRRYIKAAMRFSVLFLLSIAAPIAGGAEGVMRLAYSTEYLAGSSALEILVFGMAAFALFVIASTIITSAGRPGSAATIGAIALVVVIVLNVVLVRVAGFDGDRLAAAATATSIGTCIALFGAGGVLFARFRTFLPVLTGVRAAVAGAAAFAASDFVADHFHARIMGIAALAAGFFAFLIVLVISGEIGKEDRAAIRKIIKR